MGASPGLSPSKVAYTFAQLYYRVAAELPDHLPQLYGEDSEIQHDHLYASGTEKITLAIPKLPLTGKKASLCDLTVHTTGSGFVVIILGALPDNRMFSQTFILEQPDGSHPEHLYCRHDIFCLLPSDPQAAAVKYDKDAHEFIQESMTVEKPDIDVGANTPPPTCSDGAPETTSPASVVVATPKKVESPESSPVSDVSVPKDKSVPDVIVVKSPAAKPASRKDSPRTSKNEAPAKVPEKTVGRSAPAKKESGKTAANRNSMKVKPVAAAPTKPAAEPVAEKVASPPPPPKTWASIVSTQKAAPNASAATPAVDQPAAAPQHAEAVNGGASGAGPAGAQSANKPHYAKHGKQGPKSAGQGKGGKNLGIVNASKAGVTTTPAANAPSGTAQNANQGSQQNQQGQNQQNQNQQTQNQYSQNQHYGNHNNNHSQYQHQNNGHEQHYKGRVFGPSAVVQLGAVSDRVQNTKELVHSFKEEFGQYGHRVRHVEIKAAKGLAFIEYDTAEGVRAAVAAWANGARTDGKFAGVPLSVTEKRSGYLRRPGSMRGGGRGGGGMRGRRGRPTSSPAS